MRNKLGAPQHTTIQGKEFQRKKLPDLVVVSISSWSQASREMLGSGQGQILMPQIQ